MNLKNDVQKKHVGVFLLPDPPPQGSPASPEPPGASYGRLLKKCFFRKWPQNLYSEIELVESFNLVPISSKMVHSVTIYGQKTVLLNFTVFLSVKVTFQALCPGRPKKNTRGGGDVKKKHHQGVERQQKNTRGGRGGEKKTPHHLVSRGYVPPCGVFLRRGDVLKIP